MFGSVLYGADKMVSDMVASKIPHVAERGFGQCRAIGVIRGGNLIGGIVFHNFYGHAVEMSGAFENPSWCTPATLRRLFAFPFIELGVTNLLTVTGRKNTKVRNLDKWLGFREVGIIHQGLDGKQDAVLMEMPRKNCRWLRK